MVSEWQNKKVIGLRTAELGLTGIRMAVQSTFLPKDDMTRHMLASEWRNKELFVLKMLKQANIFQKNKLVGFRM